MDITTNDLLGGLTTLVDAAQSGDANKVLHDPTALNYAICVALILLCFVVSVLANNYSQVDKLWSITPWVYAWVWAFASQGDVRVVTAAVVATVWGIRLTLNFNRRGGYTWPPWEGEEDYRWEHVKVMLNAKKYPLLWHLFNFGFICVVQHVLLLWTAFPVQAAYALSKAGKAEKFGALDAVATVLILALVALEAVADNEQFDFQTEKYRLLKEVKNDKRKLPFPYNVGFCTTGVFALSRHPNYFAEQSIWVVMNLYAVAAAGSLGFHWCMVGCIFLILIFSQSLPLAERITSEKWPLYKEYQKQVPSLFPIGRGVDWKNKVQ